jgi:chemotaxis signal transduction protein
MTTPVVMFAIGEDRYAIATSAVREVVSDPRPTRLPTAPAMLLGAFNLRGEVVPLFDTAALLGIGMLIGAPVAVVVNTASGPAGLAVSGLPKVVGLDNEVGRSELHGTRGVYVVDDAIAILLDVEALFGPHPVLAGGAAGEVLTSS